MAEDPCPPGLLGALGAGVSRLHIGSYLVLYEIGETTIWVRRVARAL